MFRVGKALKEEHLQQIEFQLKELLKNTKASLSLVVDETGQLIASSGFDPTKDPVIIGVLAAGNYGATLEVAKLIGEKEFTLILQQGEKENIHIASIEDKGILVIVFDSSLAIGLIRMYVDKTVKALGPILREIYKTAPEEKEKKPSHIPTGEELDKLFGW